MSLASFGRVFLGKEAYWGLSSDVCTGGLSPEEIKNFFPVSLKELKKEKLGQFVHKAEEMRASAVKDARAEVLKRMDGIHMKKRQEKEAEFDKENPDFVPTRRLRGGR
ncbi:MAG: hypothetical protein SGBAC_008449 [Bacillariaceae sp.]